MRRRFTLLLALLGVLSMTALLAGGPADAKTHTTREGLTIALSAAQQSVRAVPPLDSSPLSGQALKRPGFSGGSQLTEDESHGSTTEVPGRVA